MKMEFYVYRESAEGITGFLDSDLDTCIENFKANVRLGHTMVLKAIPVPNSVLTSTNNTTTKE